MAPHIADVLLWLFVINLGVTFGAGLYESRVAVPQWLPYSPGSGYRWDAAAAREANPAMAPSATTNSTPCARCSAWPSSARTL